MRPAVCYLFKRRQIQMSVEKVENIIVIGTSAGGLTALARLVATFPADFNAAVFIVIHLGRHALDDVVLKMVQKRSKLVCSMPYNGERIRTSMIYIARPDHHLMLNADHIGVKRGRPENHWRPSIDVLFRSAAAAYGQCVTGIVLTGLLNDGTSGMRAIRRKGGILMVQDPAEAEYPDMPDNVLANMDVDYKVFIDEMGHILADLFSRKQRAPLECEPDIDAKTLGN